MIKQNKLEKKFNKEVRKNKGPRIPFIIGMKHNMLTVVDYRYNPKAKYDKLLWIVECDCGNTTHVRSKKHLEKRIGCQACTTSIAMFKGDINLPFYKKKAKRYKDDAHKRHLDFELTQEECFELFKGNCYYCGEPPMITTGDGSKRRINTTPMRSNGIDRKNSNIGYIQDNVVSCCKICNYGKHQQSEEDFYKWINKVYEFQTNK